ncbi:MAG: condensation domain-containing protein, partial [Acidobacteria bacterium]|nr:condensation domain-containing protein [Acidobacteriota bacterium]
TGRRHEDLNNIIGMFVNMLAIRNRPGRNKFFKEFLQEIKESVIESMDNQDYHFSELVLALGLQGDSSRNPLFDMAFIMQNISKPKTVNKETVDSSDTSYNLEFHVASFDLLLAVFEDNGIIFMLIDYSTALFHRTTIEGMVQHYKDILRQIIVDNDVRLRDIAISHGLVEADSGVVEKDQDEFDF